MPCLVLRRLSIKLTNFELIKRIYLTNTLRADSIVTYSGGDAGYIATVKRRAARGYGCPSSLFVFPDGCQKKNGAMMVRM